MDIHTKTGDHAFDSVHVANTPSRAAVYFDPDTLRLLKSYLEMEEERPIYVKVVAHDEDSFSLQPSTVKGGKHSGFYLLSYNDKAKMMSCPLDIPRHHGDALYGKTATVGFLRVGKSLAESRIVVRFPTARKPVRGMGPPARPPEPVTVIRYQSPQESYTPKAMTPVQVLSGFRRVTCPVVYECERTGEKLEFNSDAEAYHKLAGRAQLMDFCAKHDVKFERNATIEAILLDPETIFEALSEMLAAR
jgi:hypothetical protein